MDKLLLVDAYALIFRSYYALIRAPRITSQGRNTSAIYGFVTALREVVRTYAPTHLGVAFDPKGPTFRHEEYPAYKAQRDATPEDIHAAVPVIRDILSAYHIPCYEVSGFEADDVIGTLACRAAERDIDTLILTPDKDYAQLVKPQCRLLRPARTGGGFELWGEDEVKEKYGLSSPLQMIDLLGLMGDKADNIPGCPGVGEKTAQKLLAEYGSIDGLLSRAGEVKGALGEKVRSGGETLRLSRHLVTIRTDVPVDLDMEALRRREPDYDRLAKLWEELEFRTFLKRDREERDMAPSSKEQESGKNETPAKREEKQGDLFAVNPIEGAETGKETILSGVSEAPFQIINIDNEEIAKKIRQKISLSKVVSLDISLSSDPLPVPEGGLFAPPPSPFPRAVSIGLALDDEAAYLLPLPEEGKPREAIWALLSGLFSREDTLWTGHDLKSQLLALWREGVRPCCGLCDLMLAHYVLLPGQAHSLERMRETLLPSMREAEEGADACAVRAMTLWRLREPLLSRLKAEGGEAIFQDVEMPLMETLAAMEEGGVRVDPVVLRDISRGLTARMNEAEKDIAALAGGPFNINSPRQVGEVLFSQLHLSDKAKKTKGGQYVTSEEVLESLREAHPIVPLILQYRGLKKLVSTYVDALPALISPLTGRIHTHFNQAVTVTGRLSSSSPNLQNIPVRGEDGREIRRAFVPDEGCLFFSADYSQIELRVMAHLSCDGHMREAFLSGLDIHAATAAKIYHKPLEDVTKEERRRAKTANFGIIYGISAFGLSQRLSIPRGEAKELIEGYFSTFPGVREYIERSLEEARRKGSVETLLGRRALLPDINSRSATVRGYAERFAINAPIQGSAADIIKLAMVRIHRRMRSEGLASRLILQVHDELNFSVVPEERDILERLVLEEMRGAYPLSVPLEADSGWGENWLEAH